MILFYLLIYLLLFIMFVCLFVCLFIVSYALSGEQIQGYTVAGGVRKARISYPSINQQPSSCRRQHC